MNQFNIIRRLFLLTLALLSSLDALAQLETVIIRSDVNYAIVIDAGSTASRISIFELVHQDDQIPQIAIASGTCAPHDVSMWMHSEKDGGGIHNVRQDLTNISDYLESLADFAIERLKSRDVAPRNVPVYFRATGGVRSLTPEHQRKLLDGVVDYFHARGFIDASAKILDGSTEGIYAWISVNYLNGFLSASAPGAQSQGVLDMGGASTQITFMPKTSPAHHGVRLVLNDKQFDLYSYSHQGLGLNSAIESIASHSCFPEGVERDEHVLSEYESLASFLQSTPHRPKGHYNACRENIATHLREQCEDPRECGIKDIYQPDPHGSFVAIVAFPHFVRDFELENLNQVTLDRFGEKACLPWTELKATHQSKTLSKYLAGACFESAFFSALFDGYGFARHDNNVVADKHNISWALGVVVFEAQRGRLIELPHSDS
jgi:Golgi nucleoside diphosphatase